MYYLIIKIYIKCNVKIAICKIIDIFVLQNKKQ